jgi:hypothetical protein
MVIAVINAAIKKGIQAVHKADRIRERENAKNEAGEPFNFSEAHAYDEGVRGAAEVIYTLFECCNADGQQVIRKLAEKYDGITGNTDYFNQFIEEFQKVRGYIKLRTC